MSIPHFLLILPSRFLSMRFVRSEMPGNAEMRWQQVIPAARSLLRNLGLRNLGLCSPQLHQRIYGSGQQQGRRVKTGRRAGKPHRTYRMPQDSSECVASGVQDASDDSNKVEDRPNPPRIVESKGRQDSKYSNSHG
jgi:hypothetical protein